MSTSSEETCRGRIAGDMRTGMRPDRCCNASAQVQLQMSQEALRKAEERLRAAARDSRRAP